MLSDLAWRKAKADLELRLTKDVKCNRKGFCKDINSQRKTRENINLLLNGERELVTPGTEKAKLLSVLCQSLWV